MLHFDADYRETATLRDGTNVLLRLVEPTDKSMLVRGLQRLSPESRYLRFFTSKNRLSEQELSYLTEIDQLNHFAMGAVRQLEDGSEEGLGVGRYVVLDEGADVAEPAIAVVDDMQGQGLGRLLFLRLVAAARERGITRFRSEVLAENHAMLKLLHDLAPGAVQQVDGALVVVQLMLPELHATEAPTSQRGRGPVYRLLAMAAERMVEMRHLLERLTQRRTPENGSSPGDGSPDSSS